MTLSFIDKKRSENVLGQPYARVAAQAVQRRISHVRTITNGIQYAEGENRPAAGGFALISTEAVAKAASMITSLGLQVFENTTPIEFFKKPTQIIEVKHVGAFPIESDTIFEEPEDRRSGMVQLRFFINILDPYFVNGEGRILQLSALPKSFVEGLFNVLNPYAFLEILNSQGRLDGLFSRAGKFQSTFQSEFARAAKRMRDSIQTSLPSDMSAKIEDFLIAGVWHEYVHALALSLPDRLEKEGLSEDNKQRLKAFGFAEYLKTLNNQTELHSGVIYAKNLIKALEKALESVKDKDVTFASAEEKSQIENQIIEGLALEMFCDRFSMYLYETALKLEIYQKQFPDFSIKISTLQKYEQERKANETAFKRQTGLSDEQIRELKQAERRHFFVSVYQEPVISEAERKIFDPFLELLTNYDRTGSIKSFTLEHTRGSFFRASGYDSITV